MEVEGIKPSWLTEHITHLECCEMGVRVTKITLKSNPAMRGSSDRARLNVRTLRSRADAIRRLEMQSC